MQFGRQALSDAIIGNIANTIATALNTGQAGGMYSYC